MPKLLFSLLMFCSLAASAGAYRWVDENGKVHYGDQPPAGAQRLQTPPKPAQPRDSSTDDKRKRPQATPPADKGAYKSASFDEICQELTARLERYRSAPHMAVADDDGQPRNLDAQERQDLIDKTQQQADAACAKAE